MSEEYPLQPASGDLFDRVVSILEQARAVSGRQIHHNACDVLETVHAFI